MNYLIGTVFDHSLPPKAPPERTKEAEQDGADFYKRGVHEEGTELARYEYPFTSRNLFRTADKEWPDQADIDNSALAEQEAAAMFLRDNPEYRLVPA